MLTDNGITPPTVGPIVGASTYTMPGIAGTGARCLPSKIVTPP